jgi:serpin B
MRQTLASAITTTAMCAALTLPACSANPGTADPPAPKPAACSAPQSDLSSAKALATANTTFSLAMYPKTVAQAGTTANLIVSPYSASVALTLLQGGAAGQTAAQIQAALDLPGNAKSIAPAYATLACTDETDGSSSGNTLTISNAVWAQKGMTLMKPFVSLLASGYAAPLQQTNFANATAAVADIDGWVSHATDGQIPQLLRPSDVSINTRLVLVNAVYFHGAWATAFDPSDTAPAPFTLADGTKTNVPTMSGSGITASGSIGANLTALELPYKGGAIVMDFLMPSGSLTEFEAGLTSESLDSALHGMSKSQFDISLPKFSFKNSLRLIPILEQLGMLDVFMPHVADLSGIDGTRDLYVNLVVQDAMVEVDEQGTVAAAATAVEVSQTTGVVEALSIVIDRPFLFLIRDVSTGSVLFMGRVENPAG